MYEFTLLKSMFFELDKYKIEGVTQTQEGQRTFHRLEVSYDSVPEVTSITAEERILPYVDRYYLFINDERVETDIRDPKVNADCLPSYSPAENEKILLKIFFRPNCSNARLSSG